MREVCNKVSEYLNSVGYKSRVVTLPGDRPFLAVDDNTAVVLGKTLSLDLPLASAVSSRYGDYVVIQDSVLKENLLDTNDLIYIWEHENAHIQLGHLNTDNRDLEREEIWADITAVRNTNMDYDAILGIKFTMLDIAAEYEYSPRDNISETKNGIKKSIDAV